MFLFVFKLFKKLSALLNWNVVELPLEEAAAISLYVETEGEDLKVDISFEKVGHKRLMAKFAGLEIID